MTSLPCHGRISCRRCWEGTDADAEVVKDTLSFRMPQSFQVINNPGAWGSQNPKIMVLGQTKGFTQANAMADAVDDEDYEKVAFADSRDELHAILKSLGLAMEVKDIDPLFSKDQQDWHWGSIIRCTLAAWDKKISKKTNEPVGWSSASTLVGKAYKSAHLGKFPRNCTQQFLSDLPNRLRLVLVLGNAPDHIRRVRSTIANVHKDLTIHPSAPEVAYTAGGATWVHIVHPSGSARGYHSDFIAGVESTSQGNKALQARRAIAEAGL